MFAALSLRLKIQLLWDVRPCRLQVHCFILKAKAIRSF